MNMQVRELPEAQQPVHLTSEDLFGDARILTIEHQQMTYTLRITRQGKLLLTK
ncbi:MAG: hemin uptake protein HemP [Pseudomonadota bacterium]